MTAPRTPRLATGSAWVGVGPPQRSIASSLSIITTATSGSCPRAPAGGREDARGMSNTREGNDFVRGILIAGETPEVNGVQIHQVRHMLHRTTAYTTLIRLARTRTSLASTCARAVR